MAKPKRPLPSVADIDRKAGALSRKGFDQNREKYMISDINTYKQNQKVSLVMGLAFMAVFGLFLAIGWATGIFMFLGLFCVATSFMYRGKERRTQKELAEWMEKKEGPAQGGDEEQYF